MSDAARVAPAVARNREPILRVLREWLPKPALVLEIASGTGEHAAWFCGQLPEVKWQPSDRDPDALASIEAWREAAGPVNLLPALALDAAAPSVWPVEQADAVVAINMIHIAPWVATEGLMTGTARMLAAGGLLFLYGPFRVAGEPLADSNAAFDADLRRRDPAWGLRDLGQVCDLARQCGIELVERIGMPANNLSLIFRRR